jgi:hypothetical protein
MAKVVAQLGQLGKSRRRNLRTAGISNQVAAVFTD